MTDYKKIKSSMNEFDVFYISYDEPNAEENWADLQNKIPWSKRIHGVKGFDAAHKECAKWSESENFITIDGDNKIDETFFDNEIEYNPNWVYSWAARNHINYLIYGNGGMKLWPKRLVLEMETHEASDNEEMVDFCWDLPYYQMNDCYSISYNNASPYQAFRVGFREGVKLSLHEGKRVSNLHQVWHGNLKRLMIWMTVGADVENGIYAIFGTRLGCYLTNLTDFDIRKIADYDWFNETWENEWVHLIEDQEKFINEYKRLCKEIQMNLELPIANLGKNQSRFFKATLENPARLGLIVPEKAGEELLIKNRFKDYEEKS